MLEVPKQVEEGSSQNSSQYTPPVSVRIPVGGPVARLQGKSKCRRKHRVNRKYSQV
ncbi:hypothetical protein DPMN_065831 [Dreissena polymorpha]|uniref:Uncharacterized protein n=1 Tax=Dreissena polymorpha TaxID=45954 RepID=A0A9D4BRK5_DREPO|nr:hypothetical protein DPMN_065831 [Dreissena polymorpha]